MATLHEIEQWLQQGIIAAKAGQYDQARFQLLDVVEQDQTNETAWYWLYQVFDRQEDRRVCLENLILINPKNMWAKRELLNLLEQSAPVAPFPGGAPRPGQRRKAAAPKPQSAPAARPAPPPRGILLKLITAFWFGISLMLLGGGIISVIEWLFAPNLPTGSTPFKFLELTLSVVFMMTGMLALMVALSLLFRATAGYYGSILLAMGLLLVGPTFSLITDPPNYLAMTCTGGISGMIVLLTLASLSTDKDSSHDDNTTQ